MRLFFSFLFVVLILLNISGNFASLLILKVKHNIAAALHPEAHGEIHLIRMLPLLSDSHPSNSKRSFESLNTVDNCDMDTYQFYVVCVKDHKIMAIHDPLMNEAPMLDHPNSHPVKTNLPGFSMEEYELDKFQIGLASVGWFRQLHTYFLQPATLLITERLVIEPPDLS